MTKASAFPPSRVWLAALLLGAFTVGVGISVRNWAESQGFLPEPTRGSDSAALRPAPSFRLPDDQGRKRTLVEFRGKVIVLHYWATWCAPCLEELPQFVELARKMENRPLVWIAISLDRNWDEAHRYLKPEKLPPNLISLLDSENETPKDFGSYQFPETYLITPDLKILSKWVGPQAWDGDRMSAAIDKVIELTIPKKH